MNNRFLKWLDNYWYHYKWRTIIIVFFAAVVIFCVVQCSAVEKYDAMIFYAGPEQLREEDCRLLSASLATRLEGDFNGDGEKTLTVRSYYILSPKQLEEKREEAKKEGMDLYYTDGMRNTAINDLTITLGDGACYLLLIDPYLYDLYREQADDYFLPLSELFPETHPPAARDDCAIAFCELPFAVFHREHNTDYSTVFRTLPEDTLLCVLNPKKIRGPFSEKELSYALSLYRAIVNYTLG